MKKIKFTFFTAEGHSFSATGTSLIAAYRKVAGILGGQRVVAAVESASVVQPSPGKLTALIVANRPQVAPFSGE